MPILLSTGINSGVTTSVVPLALGFGILKNADINAVGMKDLWGPEF